MATSEIPLLTPELLAQLERLELVSRKIFRGRIKGERRSLRKGQSVEFADFRCYVPGDDLRFVDWNTYARLDRLFLKLFLEEEDLHFYALLDASESMNFGTPTKLEFAKRLAAALGFIGLIRSDRVKIETFGQPASQPGPSLRGRQSVWRLLDYLAAIEPMETTSLSTGIKNFCMRNSGRGIVVVLSDMMDKNGYEEGLRYLMAHRMDPYIVQVLAEEEDLHFYALLDASESMNFGTPSKLEFAKRLAAALGFIGLIRSDRVKIETLGQPASQPGPSLRGRQSVWRLLDYLNAIEPMETTSLATGIKNFCMRNSGRGIVVLISDMMDKNGYEEALRYLMAQRMDPYIVQVLAEEEVGPDIKGDLRLIDCEDDDETEISVSVPLLKRYKQTLSAFVSGLQEFCTRRGMGYLLARSNQPVDQLVTGYLRERGLIR
jgi:uncharacterized protein (DUF58 family)